MKKNCFKGCFCTKTDNAINKIIPELVSGSSTQAVTKRQALKTLKKFQGLSNFITAKAFTLIELLVVVLIIGILVAVALPQYKIAVVKSRVASILPIVATLQKAEAAYYLANGDHTRSIQELDVDIPCTEVIETTTENPFWKCGNDFLVQVSMTGAYANYCPAHNDSVEICKGNRDIQIAFNHIYTVNKGSRHCVVQNNSSLGEAVCKTLGTKLPAGDYLMP